ncbi:hypothetical protein V5799_016139 [Amblyomma americanum]|uniref:Uncharacterized protein n=1 Tax=Amblyomma americanum TaxID=6943 RepID=A0AAQ4F5X3_AMBAM
MTSLLRVVPYSTPLQCTFARTPRGGAAAEGAHHERTLPTRNQNHGERCSGWVAALPACWEPVLCPWRVIAACSFASWHPMMPPRCAGSAPTGSPSSTRTPGTTTSPPTPAAQWLDLETTANCCLMMLVLRGELMRRKHELMTE